MTTIKPLSKKQRAELEGYISVGIRLLRIVLFLVAVYMIGWLLFLANRAIFEPTQHSFLQHLWFIPTVYLAYKLSKRATKWTGGRQLITDIKKDLAENSCSYHQLSITDAIEVEEAEDEGPSYFVKTHTGETYLFTGQYLSSNHLRGFPWKEFEILESTNSKVFFGFRKIGSSLKPSITRGPFSHEEDTELDHFNCDFKKLDLDFETIKKLASNL